ncbi:nose resistant to fluoxetine protein 6-like [Onthophagus taurus]|uniref:nose resistant to fluoxetine protein 6-like n=1 Tax=Onthophagus taurus TaxID=166361 RepID=UPI000C201D1A|nr:nose resistant to fluoxetine protein 6-like [Onthophagus taurus]
MFPKWNILFFLVLVSVNKVRCDTIENIVSNKHLFPTLPIASVDSKNDLCKSESETYVNHLNNLTLWAHKMWDATAKSTTGILQGNNFEMGDFDECMIAQAPFKTQFCFAVVTANISNVEPPDDQFSLYYDPMDIIFKRLYRTKDISQATRDTIRLGWCVPASCSVDELEMSLNEHLKSTEFYLREKNISYYGVVPEILCQTPDGGKPFDGNDIFFCIIIGLFLFLVIVATMYDTKLENELTEKEKSHYQKNVLHRIIMGFSARRNFLEMTKAEDSNKALKSLYGLRTTSIFMIIMGHRFGTFTSGPVINFDYIETQYRSLAGWFIFHGDLFVDTFFIISGILVTYGLISQYEKRFINPGFVIFLRYMRLTPLYALVIFYYVTILNYIGSGPLWKMIVTDGESMDCRNNWWTNILYINNYVNEDHICMTQTWYLSCDIHYFIIAIILIIIGRNKKKVAIGLFFLLLFLSLAIPFIITLAYLRPALLYFYPEFLTNPKGHPDFRLTYIKSHTRATPYFIGMIAGYIYYKMKDNEYRLSKVLSHFLTLISIILLFIGIASSGIFYNPYHKYNAIEAAAYAGLHRLTWAIGTIGLLLTGSFGHTSVVHKVLSWSPFIPLSKLVYGAYLIHMSFHFRFLAMTTGSQQFEYFKLFQLTISDIAISFIFGFIMYILIETPIRKLCKELFMGKRKSHSERENNVPNNNDSRL